MATDQVLAAADALVAAGDGVWLGAATEPGVPGIPEDRFDLDRGLLAFDEARAAFARRFADGLHAAGARITGVALDVLAADGARAPFPLPAAATTDPARGR
jgi:hypothetical protein